MADFFYQYQLLIDSGLIAMVLALGQYVVLKAGVFSMAPVGLAALSAYTTAILQVRHGVGPWPSLLVGVLVAVVVSLLLAFPLARLRGIFQAIATMSFVVVVQSLVLVFTDLTGGPNGIIGIPQTLGTGALATILVLCVTLLILVNRSRIGQAFDALRQDEIAAASHGISVFRYHTYAFGLSGLLAGLAGGMSANHTYTVLPDTFGFPAVVNTLTYVVIGGVVMTGGPLLGTAFLLVLPEIVRPLAQERMIVNGLLLLATVIFMPHGIVDGMAAMLRARRARRAAPSETAEPPAEPAAPQFVAQKGLS